MFYNYRGYQKLGMEGMSKAVAVFSRGIKQGYSANRVQRELKRQGLSYRRINILRDYRLAQATLTAKSERRYNKALYYFNNVFEPLREKHGWTSKKTRDFLANVEHKKQHGIALSEEEAEIEERYEEEEYII